MQESIHKLEPLYPDVLGSITGGSRISMDKLQCALGIFPTQTYMNQPVEVILILQNMVDQQMQIKVHLQLPSQDKKGNPVVIDTAKKTLALSMRPGEVGVLRIPIIPLPPTQAGTGFPVRIAVRYRTPNEGHPVRPPAGGAPPSVLSISSFKLQALREVAFSAHMWNESAEIITTYFDIAPKRTPPIGQDLQAKYESLWTMEEMVEERELVQAKLVDAQRIASSLTRSTVYMPMMMAVEEHFAERGMPLHPGEMRAIAKMMTYTMDEGLELEPGFSMEDSRWFLTLCQVLAHNPDLEHIDRSELVTKYLFEATLYDAILLGFSTIDPKVKEDLGDAAERVNYATRVLAWFAGEGDPDPSYIYLPLAMGGVVVNMLVASKDENPWLVVDQLTEANRGRARLASGEVATIFKVMDSLLNQAEDALRRARVSRP